jgi:hypothetical protein
LEKAPSPEAAFSPFDTFLYLRLKVQLYLSPRVHLSISRYGERGIFETSRKLERMLSLANVRVKRVLLKNITF